MAAVSEWSDLFAHTITHKPFSSRDEFGAVTYGAGTSFSARLVEKPTHVRGSDGNEVVARGVVWILGTPSIDAEDQIVLPDGSTPPILAVSKPADEIGTHHVKVFFG